MISIVDNYVYKLCKLCVYGRYLCTTLTQTICGLKPRGGKSLVMHSLYPTQSQPYTQSTRVIFKPSISKIIDYTHYPQYLLLLLLKNIYKYDKIRSI